MNETIPYLPGLSPVSGKELHARFDGGRLSSDGGVLLLREIENGLGLADLLSSCIKDERDPSSTTHTHADMIRARLFAISCEVPGTLEVPGTRYLIRQLRMSRHRYE